MSQLVEMILNHDRKCHLTAVLLQNILKLHKMKNIYFNKKYHL